MIMQSNHPSSALVYSSFVLFATQTDPDGKKHSFRPLDIVPVIVLDMRSKLKDAIRRNSAFMTRLHKPDNDDFCAPRVKTYELPELLKLYINAAVPYFRKLIQYQVGYISKIYIDTHASLKSVLSCCCRLKPTYKISRTTLLSPSKLVHRLCCHC